MNVRRVAAAFVVMAALLGRPDFAFAHATPMTYEPAASSVLAAAPQAVAITFSERIEPAASSIIVYAPDGGRAEAGDAGVGRKDAHVFSVPVRDAGFGTYTVSWQVVSADDGHFTKGAFTYAVGKETAPAAAAPQGFQISHSSSVPDAATIWLELLGHAILSALLVCLLLIWRPLRRRGDLAAADAAFWRRADALALLGSCLGFVGAVSGLALKSFELSLAQSVSFADALPKYMATAAGTYGAVMAVSALGFGAVWFGWRRRVRDSAATGTLSLLAILLIIDAFSRARVSHAAASHLLPRFSILVNMAHVIAKDLWIGGGIVMWLAVIPALSGKRAAFAEAAAAWSRFAAWSIGAAGVTGAYIVWLHLKDPANLFTTDWGGRFMLLAFAGGMLFAVRVGQLLFTEPKLAEDETARNYAQLLGVEAVIGAAMLAITAILIITTPPLPRGAAWRESASSEGLRVTVEERADDRSSLHVVTQDDKTGAPASPWDVIVTLENHGLGIGPIVAPVEQRAANSYAFSESLLSPPGEWTIGVTVRQRKGYDATASFVLDHPRRLEEGRTAAERRTYGLFDVACAAAALLFAAIGLAMARWPRHRVAGEAEKISGPPPYRPVPPWLAAAVVVPLLLFGARQIAFKGAFQKRCEANLHFWNQSVPLRAGTAISPLAVSGCTVGAGAGAYHFADEDEYRFFARPSSPTVALSSEPALIKAGEPARLAFRITDGGLPARDLVIEHDRLLHAVIVSRDFSVFAHRHVEDDGPITAEMREQGVYPVTYVFPKAGRYLVALDYVIRSTYGSSQFLVDVAGDPQMGAVAVEEGREKNVDGYGVKLTTSPKTVWAHRITHLHFTISKDGLPVTELQPYLGAAMHVAVVQRGFGWASATADPPPTWSERLLAMPANAHVVDPSGLAGGTGAPAIFLHAHGEPRYPWYVKLLTGGYGTSAAHAAHASIPAAFGPTVDAHVIFPAGGSYVVFGEFMLAGKVHVAPFVVEAREP